MQSIVNISTARWINTADWQVSKIPTKIYLLHMHITQTFLKWVLLFWRRIFALLACEVLVTLHNPQSRLGKNHIAKKISFKIFDAFSSIIILQKRKEVVGDNRYWIFQTCFRAYHCGNETGLSVNSVKNWSRRQRLLWGTT